MIVDLDQVLTLEEAQEHYEARPDVGTAKQYLYRAQQECERGLLSLHAFRDLRAQLDRERPHWTEPARILLAS